MKINSSAHIQFSDDGSLVYFNINVKELFDVNLRYPGIKNALNVAFSESKSVVPIKTGLMRRSYTMDILNEDTIRVYFDPNKIVGQKRLGTVVKEYYPKYLKEHSKTFNWLDVVMSKFLKSLYLSAKELERKKERDDAFKLVAFLALYKTFINQLDKKIKEGGN